MTVTETQPKENSLVYNPEVFIFQSAEEVDKYAAGEVISLLHNKPKAVLTLPTGSTPRGMYQLLIEAYREGKLDFGKATVFNLDEYWPIDPNHPASYAYYMQHNFFDHINLPPENRHIPDGSAEDPNKESERYNALLHNARVNLAILGIGPDLTCHVGFNEVGSDINSRTRYVKLDPRTSEANKKYFTDPEEIPSGALTQGIMNILEAERILLLAKGAAKAEGVARTLLGEISSEAPASFLRYHPNVIIVLDSQAASRLSLSTVI